MQSKCGSKQMVPVYTRSRLAAGFAKVWQLITRLQICRQQPCQAVSKPRARANSNSQTEPWLLPCG